MIWQLFILSRTWSPSLLQKIFHHLGHYFQNTQMTGRMETCSQQAQVWIQSASASAHFSNNTLMCFMLQDSWRVARGLAILSLVKLWYFAPLREAPKLVPLSCVSQLLEWLYWAWLLCYLQYFWVIGHSEIRPSLQNDQAIWYSANMRKAFCLILCRYSLWCISVSTSVLMAN